MNPKAWSAGRRRNRPNNPRSFSRGVRLLTFLKNKTFSEITYSVGIPLIRASAQVSCLRPQDSRRGRLPQVKSSSLAVLRLPSA